MSEGGLRALGQKGWSLTDCPFLRSLAPRKGAPTGTASARPPQGKGHLRAPPRAREPGLRADRLLSSPQDDGAIRVWKNFADLEKNPEMVTAWQGLSDMLPTNRGQCQGQSCSHEPAGFPSPKSASTWERRLCRGRRADL